MEATLDEALQEAIRRAGGLRALARALGVSHPAVAQWDRAPPRRTLDIERLTGVSRHDLRPDLYPPNPERHVPPPPQPAKAPQEKAERQRARLEAEFEERVRREVTRRCDEVLLPMYGEKLRQLDLLMAHTKPFTNAEFRCLLAAMHPDCQNAEVRGEAFELLKSREVVLRQAPKPPMRGEAVPKTLEELLAGKAQATAERAEKRKQRQKPPGPS